MVEKNVQTEGNRRNVLMVLFALTDTFRIPQGLERNEAVCKLGFHCAQPCHTIRQELTRVYEKAIFGKEGH